MRPRLIVLTNAKPGEAVTEYITDRDRFPAEALFTTDLAKARTWGYPPGVRRWYKRNIEKMEVLKTCRRVWVAEELILQARKADKAASSPTPAPAKAKPSRATPNKRPRPAVRKPGARKAKEVRKLSRRAATSRPPKALKVA